MEVESVNNGKKDMCLPAWVCWTGLFFIAMAIGWLIGAILSSNLLLVIGIIVCFGIGISAVLCWKNQWIQMLDTDSFVYSTMFGNETQYDFTQVRELRLHSDSATLILETGKVHIEKCAILSKRFKEAIGRALVKTETDL